jgi:hypothetical protein
VSEEQGKLRDGNGAGGAGGVRPCRAGAGLAGRGGAQSCHIPVAEKGSSETWHGRLRPGITHRHQHPSTSRRLLRLLLVPVPSLLLLVMLAVVLGAVGDASLLARQGPPQPCPPASHPRRNRGDLGAELGPEREEDPAGRSPRSNRLSISSSSFVIIFSFSWR